jgi:TPP-dependent pyruvate/acetoin dehydrogenase alpha subunit
MSKELPIIRLELSVDAMRYHVVHELVAHRKEIEDTVNNEVTRLMESGYLEQKIQQSVRKHIDEAIESAVKRAVTSWSHHSPTVSQAVETAVHEALWKTEESRG